MPFVGETDLTLPAYRHAVALRTAFLPFWCKVFGILLMVAGGLAQFWTALTRGGGALSRLGWLS